LRKPDRVAPELLAKFCFDLPPVPRQLDWNTLFGNDRPVELEIGCGKGAFIVHAATTRPEVNFAGIEVVRKYQLYCGTRIARRNLTNARMACTDARFALAWSIPVGSLHAVHVYFPDPWWKARHAKRRIVTPEFLVWVIRCLKPGGTFHLASDVPDYFHASVEILDQQPLLVHQNLPDDRGTITNFERKALAKGGVINHGIWLRPTTEVPPAPPDPQRLFPVPLPGSESGSDTDLGQVSENPLDPLQL